MIRVEAIMDFNYADYDNIKNLQSFNAVKEGMIYKGDKFECTKEQADYLMGGNQKGVVVVKILEIIPEVVEEQKAEKEVKVEKPKTTKKKTTKK